MFYILLNDHLSKWINFFDKIRSRETKYRKVWRLETVYLLKVVEFHGVTLPGRMLTWQEATWGHISESEGSTNVEGNAENVGGTKLTPKSL